MSKYWALISSHEYSMIKEWKEHAIEKQVEVVVILHFRIRKNKSQLVNTSCLINETY